MQLKTIALAVALSVSGTAWASATHDAFVDVTNSANTDGFNNLSAARITTPQLVAGVASNVNEGASDATLKRLSGGFYPASFGLYSWSTDSNFSLSVGSAIAGLTSITLQSFITVDTTQGVDGLLQAGYLPSLSFNGGTQALTPVWSVTPVSGGFGMDGSPLPATANNPNYGVFTWDLTGVTTPVTSFAVNFGIDTHASALAFQLDQVAAVPEPGTYAMMLAGMGLIGMRLRRSRKQDAA